MAPKIDFLVRASINGRVRKARIDVFRGADKNPLFIHTANLEGIEDRQRAARKIVERLKSYQLDFKPTAVENLLERHWTAERSRLEQERAAQAAAPGNPGNPCFPYLVEAGRICRLRHGPEGSPYPEPLCNFTALIVREEILDDGSTEDRHTFAVEGALADGTPLPASSVPAAEFASMAWPLKSWGVRAVVFAGQGTKDHLRVALQELSSHAERHRIYKHTGWRQHDGAWVFLHAGGAVGAQGTIRTLRVELDGKLGLYHLPDPPQGMALALAIKADLRLLEAAAPRLMFPLVAAVYRATLGAADWSLAYVGPTGLGKSEVTALGQQHFGAAMNRLSLPGNWASTANALEGLAFLAKDALLVIDDFKPGGSRGEIDQLHQKADRVLRSQGNNSARQRCWADGTVRAERPPRGLIVLTGEDMVRGESLRARQLPLLVHRGDLDVCTLTPYQQDAAAGLYAQTLSAFLRWLSPQYAEVRSRLPAEHAAFRQRALAEGNHPRSPSIVADLALGLDYFLNFAVACRAIRPAAREKLAQAGWQAFAAAAADQAVEIRAQDPARRFLQLAAAVITSQQGHLASRDGGAPTDPAAWGWRKVESGSGQFQRTSWQPQGKLLGWLDGGDAFLDPETAFAEVQRLADAQGERLPLSQHQLYRRLKEQRLLASSEPDKTTVRRKLQGKVRAVLHLSPGPYPPSGKQGFQGFQGE
jgi:hypothetical protein